MGKTVTLLRPFVFSSPATPNNRLPTERWFHPAKDHNTGEWIPTEVELPDSVAEHPFIHAHFADGCIERPEVTAARIQEEQEKRDKERELAAKELKKAEEALKRASGTHIVHKEIDDEVARQLNTPVNQLGAQQGKDLGKKVGDLTKAVT